MTLKRTPLIFLTVVVVTASAAAFCILGFGRDTFVGNISVAFGPTTYAISVREAVIAMVVLVGLITVMATRRFAK